MRRLLWVLLIGFVVSACNSSNSAERDQALAEISQAEEFFTNQNSRDAKPFSSFDMPEDSLLKVIDLYLSFANDFPEDSLAAELLFKAAELQKNYLRDFEKAIYLLDQAYKKYPEHHRAPYCLFFLGLIYQDDMKELEAAKERYEWFLKQYPDHDFADDVQFLLDNLGKSDEEILKDLEKKAKEAEAAQS
ncbi:MAG: tetratricopeptide repeat protein [Bacteroidetes bacterium]|nr:tetratricopeptide repeat protein [Bacteroidota bacterium]